MKISRFRKNWATIFILNFIFLHANGQENSLIAYYTYLRHSAAEGKLPPNLEVVQMLEKVADMSYSDIVSALPAMISSLQDDHLDVRKYAGLGLFAIGTRPDGAQLLSPHLSAILHGLDDPDNYVKSGLLGVIEAMRPNPPISVIPVLLKRLPDTSRIEDGTTIVAIVVKLAPNRADVVEAVVSFLSSQELTGENRVRTLRWLGIKTITSPALISAVVQNTSASQPEYVQLQAIETLGIIGPAAAAVAGSTLNEISANTDRPDTVRQAAKDALKSILNQSK